MRPLTISSRWPLLVAALALLLALIALGCDELTTGGSIVPTVEGDVGTSAESTVSSADVLPTTTGPLVSTATTAPLASSESLLPSGHIRACGLIKEVWEDGSGRHLKIDYVDFLTGADADAAAIADGVILPGEHVDNDYYTRNVNPKLREFTVANDVVIITYSRQEPIDVADPVCSWGDFYDFWNLVGLPPPEDMGLSEGLWWIERDGDTIVKIEQQWVP